MAQTVSVLFAISCLQFLKIIFRPRNDRDSFYFNLSLFSAALAVGTAQIGGTIQIDWSQTLYKETELTKAALTIYDPVHGASIVGYRYLLIRAEEVK
jgi:hypothetical protein